MSVQIEINRIKTNVASAYSAIEEKGGTLPTSQNSANLPSAIRSIPTPTENMVLLWENAAPTTTFAPQTLNIDVSSYKMVLIISKGLVPYNRWDCGLRNTIFTDKMYGSTYPIEHVTYSAQARPTREVTVKNTSIVFGTGVVSGGNNNNAVIPMYIYGIK